MMGGLTCKVRHFIALVISVTLTSLILSVYNQKQPHTLQDIVSQTHRQLESIKENIQAGVGDGWVTDKHLELEEKYLISLGFVRDPLGKETTAAQKLGLATSELSPPNASLPLTVATAVSKGTLFQLEDFLANVMGALPSTPLIVWNTDPESSVEENDDFSLALKSLCNSSFCIVKRFTFEDYPDHVKDLSFRAFRPLILQTMLDAGSGCVFWLDVDRRFIAQPKTNQNLWKYLENGRSGSGLVGWRSGHPTSSLTHPKMFSYFETSVENFYFHRMIDPSQLLLCKNEELTSKVMRPWNACTLKKDCIAPFGAQSGGCRFDKKPLYRYSGCHAYDASAFNVALGLALPNYQPYIHALTKPVTLLAVNSTTSA